MRRWLTVIVAAALAAGCAQLNMLAPPSGERLDRWLAENEYGRALDALQRLPARHPLRERLPAIQRQAEGYQQRVVRLARQHRAHGDWAEAFETLYDGLSHYPDGDKLQTALDRLEREQAEALARIDRQLTILRAEWQLQALAFERRRAEIAPHDRQTTWAVKETRESLQRAFPVLKDCGLEALGQDNLDRAERCLALAGRIKADDEVDDALDDLARKRAEARAAQAREERARRERAQRAQAEARRERADDLAAGAAELIARNEVQQARARLERLAAVDADHPQLMKLRRSLEATVAAQVKTLIEQGSVLYREGEIREARNTWRRALELDPDNETVRSHLQRAQRVLDKLEELREEETDDNGRTQ